MCRREFAGVGIDITTTERYVSRQDLCSSLDHSKESSGYSKGVSSGNLTTCILRASTTGLDLFGLPPI